MASPDYDHRKIPFLSRMAVVAHWSVIINTSTCTKREWERWQLLMENNKISFKAYATESIDQLSNILSLLLGQGNQSFLFAGGDGTLHHGGNLLVQLAGEMSSLITIGVLPCGTGNDWVRTFGIHPARIIESLKAGQSCPLHLIRISWPDGTIRYAFNMVGGALDAAVVKSLTISKVKIPGSIKYPIALIKTLMRPHRWYGVLKIDGEIYKGNWLTLQAGFGKYCGGGMYVLPHAETDKAALLLMKPKSLFRLFTSLPALYNGKVRQQKEAISLHFSTVEIQNDGIPIEADGEWLGMSPVNLTISYGILQRLSF
ncbi:MAG: diacylglycerol kinase family protein [Saprospiraceae bacterium]